VADLADIDLDLKASASMPQEMPDAGPPTEPPLDLDLQQEVATKLELARAYEEMGDKDGARELVEESCAKVRVARKMRLESFLPASPEF
jgi:pilus assembly protein FimV